jgi:hypothetical protein
LSSVSHAMIGLRLSLAKNRVAARTSPRRERFIRQSSARGLALGGSGRTAGAFERRAVLREAPSQGAERDPPPDDRSGGGRAGSRKRGGKSKACRGRHVDRAEWCRGRKLEAGAFATTRSGRGPRRGWSIAAGVTGCFGPHVGACRCRGRTPTHEGAMSLGEGQRQRERNGQRPYDSRSPHAPPVGNEPRPASNRGRASVKRAGRMSLHRPGTITARTPPRK